MTADITSLESFLKSDNISFHNVRRVLDLESSSACGENENFVGQVLRVRCYLELTSGEKKYVNIIVKKEPTEDQLFTSMYHELKIFQAEIEMYEKVLRNMEMMLKDSYDGNSKIWPTYYGHSHKDIFLEDLSEDGYTPYPKGQALSLDEALMVLSSLGQFHGLSLSLVQRNLYNPSKLPLNIFVQDIPALRQVEKEACDNLAAVIEADWGKEWQTYPDKLRKYGEEVGSQSHKLWHETRGKLDVINHGDCWINNILFKYDNNRVIKKIKFVDYQACHYNSYSWDLTCILFSAILPSLREPNIDKLLTAYLDNLNKYSTKTGYIGYLPSLEEVKGELDRLSLCGLIRSIISYSIFVNPEAMIPTPSSGSNEDDVNHTTQYSPSVRSNLEQTLIHFTNKNIL